MELTLFFLAPAFLLIFFAATDLTVHACLICRASHLQRPRVVFDFAKSGNHQLMLSKFRQPTQSFLQPVQPRKRIIRFDEELIYLCEGEKNTENTPVSADDTQSKLKGVMIGMIRWYRNTLSPIMPPNCRFLPSCSNYALQAIDEHGPYRGLILTAWRILRCNPIGGSGYDPPIWPPPGFFAGSNSWRK